MRGGWSKYRRAASAKYIRPRARGEFESTTTTETFSFPLLGSGVPAAVN